MKSLAALIAAKVAAPESFGTSEEATKMGLILPILAEIGWAPFDVDEVRPEHHVQGGRVDYALRLRGVDRVFLEAKKSTESLERHDDQLLQYAYRAGVKLAVLTNGLLWQLYLPLAEGSWDERRFFTIDLRQQPPPEAAANFFRLLGREAVETGDALTAAETLRSGAQRARTVRETLPVAWDALLHGPDELLVELVADKAAQLSGISPTAQEVAEFLAIAAGSPVIPRSIKSTTALPVGPIIVADPEPTSPPEKGAGFVFMRPSAYELFGVTVAVDTFKDVLLRVAADLARRHPDRTNEFLGLRGRKRAYFSEDKNELTEPRLIAGTSLWAETNLSANDIVRRCHEMLAICGHQPAALHVIAVQR